MDPAGRDGWIPYRPPGAVAPGAPAPGPDEREHAAESELWRRVREEGAADAREALVRRHGGYAKSLAARLYARRWSNEVPFEDYHQLALVGLLEAIDRYDPSRAIAFRTFATPRIQGAIRNGLERMTERQQQLTMRRRLAAERTQSLVPEHMALGDATELLNQLGDLAVGVAVAFILDGIGLGPEPREGLPGNAYREAELAQLRRRLWEGVERLPAREREVLVLHYRDGRRFDEVARALGLSKGRISQIHSQAIARLRTSFARPGSCNVAM